MYIQYTLGAIFIVFILCVHCDNAGNYNEDKKIFGESSFYCNFGVFGVITNVYFFLIWGITPIRDSICQFWLSVIMCGLEINCALFSNNKHICVLFHVLYAYLVRVLYIYVLIRQQNVKIYKPYQLH